jgi:hypothetical protein
MLPHGAATGTCCRTWLARAIGAPAETPRAGRDPELVSRPRAHTAAPDAVQRRRPRTRACTLLDHGDRRLLAPAEWEDQSEFGPTGIAYCIGQGLLSSRGVPLFPWGRPCTRGSWMSMHSTGSRPCDTRTTFNAPPHTLIHLKIEASYGRKIVEINSRPLVAA